MFFLVDVHGFSWIFMDFHHQPSILVDTCWDAINKLNHTRHQEDRGRLENGEPAKQCCGNKGYR